MSNNKYLKSSEIYLEIRRLMVRAWNINAKSDLLPEWNVHMAKEMKSIASRCKGENEQSILRWCEEKMHTVFKRMKGYNKPSESNYGIDNVDFEWFKYQVNKINSENRNWETVGRRRLDALKRKYLNEKNFGELEIENWYWSCRNKGEIIPLTKSNINLF